MSSQSKIYPGFFITFEGGEGAGKSSIMQAVAEKLRSEGRRVIATREPGGSDLGNAIRSLVLLDDGPEVGDRAELLLFLAARAQHIEELILPELQQGAIVLCDRFNDSSIAYQGAARTGSVEKSRQLCDLVCDGLTPELTLLLDVDPVQGLARSKGMAKRDSAKGDLDRIEQVGLEFHRKVRSAFLAMADEEPDRFVVIDSEQSLEDAVTSCYQTIENFFHEKQTS